MSRDPSSVGTELAHFIAFNSSYFLSSNPTLNCLMRIFQKSDIVDYPIKT